MKHISRTLPGIVLLTLLLAPACSTSTRLGYLIPKHPKSELVKGEVAVAGYVQITPFGQSGIGTAFRSGSEKLATGAEGAVVAFVAGLAIDAVKRELDREAEKYEKQYTARTAVTLEELGQLGYLIYARCTEKGKNDPDIKTWIKSNAHSLCPDLKHESSKTRFEKQLEALLPEDKTPQMVLAVRVKSETSAATVYKASNPKLWAAGVGAKIVSFNGKQPWGWLGGLLLKTGSQAEVDIAMNVRALQMKNLTNDKATWESSWAQVEPSSPIVRGVKVKLKDPAVYSAGPKSGSWLPIPSVSGGNAPLGFMEVTFQVTEKDPSNVKQHIKEASEQIEKNKDSWIKKITGQSNG